MAGMHNMLLASAVIGDKFTLTAKQGAFSPIKGDTASLYGYIDVTNYQYTVGAVYMTGQSLSDNTFNPTGSRIEGLFWSEGVVTLSINGYGSDPAPNTGWNVLSIYHNFSTTTTNFFKGDMTFNSFTEQPEWSIASVTNPFSNTTAGQDTYEITIS